MVTEAIAAFTAVGGLGAIPTGQRVIRRHARRSCLRNIATLEREIGITEDPFVTLIRMQTARLYTAPLASKFAEMKKANRDERIRNAGYVAGRASAANDGAPRRYR